MASNDQLPKQMKAQVLESYSQPYVYKDVPLPEATSPDDLIIKVDAAGWFQRQYIHDLTNANMQEATATPTPSLPRDK